MELNAPLSRFPALPELPADIALQVFTDKSLRPLNDDGGSHSDNEALSILGESACRTAEVAMLYSRIPGLGVEAIKTARDEWTSPKVVMEWVRHYPKLETGLRCLPGTEIDIERMMRVWHAYLGGIYLSRGQQALEQFIRQLIEPTAPTSPTTGGYMPAGGAAQTGNKSDQQGMYISALHQAAIKRGVKIEYEAESKGPGHAIQWAVTVLVDGQWKGQGLASSKQTAKENAAKEAFIQLGWATG